MSEEVKKQLEEDDEVELEDTTEEVDVEEEDEEDLTDTDEVVKPEKKVPYRY